MAEAGVRVYQHLLICPGAESPRKNRDDFINYTVGVMVSSFVSSQGFRIFPPLNKSQKARPNSPIAKGPLIIKSIFAL
jgi:hypothetical protein